MNRPRLLMLATTSEAARLILNDQASHLQNQGFQVWLACGEAEVLADSVEASDVQYVSAPISREVDPWRDLASLFRLWRLMRRLRPDIVCAATPKASLLGMVAAAACRVPVRLYFLRGLRLETAVGLRARVLGACEWITCFCSHRVVAVSKSLREAALRRRLTSPAKIVAPCEGNGNGVNVEHFNRERRHSRETEQLRSTLGISKRHPVIGFVGRLTRDKGIRELYAVFERLQAEFDHLQLVLVGDFEEGDPVDARTVRRLRAHPRVRVTGFVMDAAPYYGLFDLLVFPSYREGLPKAPIEAAAAGLPVVAFAATGTVDAVLDGRTGALAPVGDVPALTEAARRYLRDPLLRIRHGEAGRKRVERQFRRETAWRAVDELCYELLAAKHPMPFAPGRRAAA